MNKIEKLVQEITLESIRATNQRKAFVFCDYYANVNGLTVWAEHIETDYDDEKRITVRLFGAPYSAIYLDLDNAEEKLNDILTKIKEL